MKHAALLCSLAVVLTSAAWSEPNAKPFVVPELREWTGGEGTFSMSPGASIVIGEGASDALKSVAEQFSRDLKTMFGRDVSVRSGEARDGDVLLTVGKTGSDNNEAYVLDIGNRVTVTGNEPVGVFWATRSLLQMLEQSTELQLPRGRVLDFPAYKVRGFMLDCGRKFFTIDFLRDYVRFMAYYKMNTFQIHLNDNGFPRFFDQDWDKTYAAFRLESSTYPGLTAKDGSYTKQQFIDLQKLAEREYVNIIPEIDVPAHSLAFSHYLPEIGSKEYGMDHLDLFSPKTYEFLDGLFKEYLGGEHPVFRGKQVNIGTDEYSNKDPKVVEQFRHFTDHYIRYVESFGKQAVVWGALTHAKGETPVKSDGVMMNIWHNPYAQPREMAKQGYDLISMPDGLLYIVPEAGYYYNYLNIKNLYQNWEPRFIGREEFAKGDPQVLGGMFALWNDHVGNGISEKDVHHRVWPAMQTLATKMWTGNNGLIPFDEFNAKRERLSEAPGVNIMARSKWDKGTVLSRAKLSPGDGTGMKEIGYGYRVQWTLKAEENPKGTVLFSSPNATFYLSDPKEGKLGFERDGYLFTFDYKVPAGQQVDLAVEGDSRSTKLYVDGKLKETLDIIWVQRGKKEKDKIAQVRTLVFPLEQVGSFKGELTDFKVVVP